MWTIKASTEGLTLSKGDVDLRIPVTLTGIQVMHRFLLAASLGEAKIASPGFPIQAQVDEMVRRHRETHPLFLTLKELGL